MSYKEHIRKLIFEAVNDSYGHWIGPDGKVFDATYSHERTAIEVIKYLILTDKVSQEDYDNFKLRFVLNPTQVDEYFLYDRGWVRGVRYHGEYYVNGKKNQQLTPKQERWLKQYGEDNNRTVAFLSNGEGKQFKGIKFIYNAEDVMEQRLDENRPLGKSVRQTGYSHNYVEIFRAMKADERDLKDKDFVTRSRQFAKEHADHMTSVKEELYHVVRYIVSPDHVFEAYNPGEYFYHGPNVKGMVVYKATDFL